MTNPKPPAGNSGVSVPGKSRSLTRETLRRIFAEQGFDVNGASPHSWRCDYPERYGGDCDCVDEMIDAVLKEIE